MKISIYDYMPDAKLVMLNHLNMSDDENVLGVNWDCDADINFDIDKTLIGTKYENQYGTVMIELADGSMSDDLLEGHINRKNPSAPIKWNKTVDKNGKTYLTKKELYIVNQCKELAQKYLESPYNYYKNDHKKVPVYKLVDAPFNSVKAVKTDEVE